MSKLKLAVLISGRGSNLSALIEAAKSPAYPAEIILVLSNKAEAGGLEIARQAGIPTAVLNHTDYDGREAFEHAMNGVIEASGAELVVLAGFMRILTPVFVDRWADRLINIHPSLLPAYPGLDTHRKAIEDGVRFAGCTIHYVRIEMDDGPIILQAAVPVLADDTPATLSARVLAEEHRLYPEAIRLIAEGRVRIEGKRAIVDGAVAPASVSNPVL